MRAAAASSSWPSIAASAWGLPRRPALTVVAAGILCFVGVHLVAAATTIYVGLALGALVFAAVRARPTRAARVRASRRAPRRHWPCWPRAAAAGARRAAVPELTLALDFTPNAVHAPIYAAVREGFDRATRRAAARSSRRARRPTRSRTSCRAQPTSASSTSTTSAWRVVRGKDVVAVAGAGRAPAGGDHHHGRRFAGPRDLEGR